MSVWISSHPKKKKSCQAPVAVEPSRWFGSDGQIDFLDSSPPVAKSSRPHGSAPVPKHLDGLTATRAKPYRRLDLATGAEPSKWLDLATRTEASRRLDCQRNYLDR